MKGSTPFAGLLCLLCAAGSATAKERAEEPDPRQYISALFSYLVLDEDRDIGNHGLGGSLAYGRQLADHWWWESEIAGYNLDADVDNASNFYQAAITTGLLYSLGDRKSLTPYLVGAVGFIRNDVIPDDDDAITFHANAGAGLVSGPLLDNGLKLRLEGRYLYDDFDGSSLNASHEAGPFNDWRFSLGIEIPLGYSKVEEKVIYETREVEVMVEEPDSDGDGIPDRRDQCPNTLKGGEVDGKGCLLTNQTISFYNIGFELNSEKVTASTRPVLDRIAVSLREQTDFQVDISGHTDSQGSAEYNEALSHKRAQSVMQYLVSQGVDASRLSASGHGELDPVASNETASGRAMNRRVEFRMSEIKE